MVSIKMPFAHESYSKEDLDSIIKKIIEVGGKDGPEKLIRGELVISFSPEVKLIKETLLYNIVQVDRSTRPTYPDWVDKVMHPEFEMVGPGQYDLAQIAQWLHPEQRDGLAIGATTIYNHLKGNDLLGSCLNLQDGFAIKGKGVLIFGEIFHNKLAFLWGSVVHSKDGKFYVPYLYEFRDEEIRISWCCINGAGCGPNNPALRFRS